MHFGVNTWVWTSPLTTDELKTLAPKVKTMGFDWIELPLEGLADFDPKTAAHIVKDNGLGVSACAAMGPDRDLIHEDKAVRDNGMAYIRAAVDALHTLGGKNLVGPIYSAVGRVWQQTAGERAKDVDLLVKQLGDLSKYAADKGVVLCVEPLNRFETSFEEKSLGDAIRAAGKRLAHFHACENDRGAPGSGHVTWNEVAKALKDINYAGPVVIESFTNKVKSIARAAAIWRAFEPSQDALAENGVRFLKKLLA
jgi:D-psicose/D-tagatose/L-ribulose 3-epimerase